MSLDPNVRKHSRLTLVSSENTHEKSINDDINSDPSEVDHKSEVDKLVDVIYPFVDKGLSRTAATAIALFVEHQFRKLDIQPINDLLLALDVRKLDARCICALVRGTARAKKELSAWQEFYYQAYLHVKVTYGTQDSLFLGMELPEKLSQPNQ